MKKLLLVLLAMIMLSGCRQEQKAPATWPTAAPTETAVSPAKGTDSSTTSTKTPTETTVSPTEGTDSPTTSTKTPTEATTSPTEPQKEPQTNTKPSNPTEDSPVTPPEDLPPVVEIPPQKDPQTGETLGVTFPCEIAGYGLTIEKLAPYSGMFVEDGTNAQVQSVAMLLVKNQGDFPLEYTSIRITYGQEELVFDISALPVGQRLVVQEKSGKAIPAGKADSATAMMVQRADMEMSETQVRVTDNGDNTLTVENLTGKTIPTVRVFYKYYMTDEDIFVGGIAFTVRITRLGAGAKVRVQPAHYTSQTSCVVMVLTYDSEV